MPSRTYHEEPGPKNEGVGDADQPAPSDLDYGYEGKGISIPREMAERWGIPVPDGSGASIRVPYITRQQDRELQQYYRLQERIPGFKLRNRDEGAVSFAIGDSTAYPSGVIDTQDGGIDRVPSLRYVSPQERGGGAIIERFRDGGWWLDHGVYDPSPFPPPGWQSKGMTLVDDPGAPITLERKAAIEDLMKKALSVKIEEHTHRIIGYNPLRYGKLTMLKLLRDEIAAGRVVINRDQHSELRRELERFGEPDQVIYERYASDGSGPVETRTLRRSLTRPFFVDPNPHMQQEIGREELQLLSEVRDVFTWVFSHGWNKRITGGGK